MDIVVANRSTWTEVEVARLWSRRCTQAIDHPRHPRDSIGKLSHGFRTEWVSSSSIQVEDMITASAETT